MQARMTVLEAKRGATANKLLRAVTTLAAKHGVGDVSSRSVADQAGVSASAVNYTFGSLETLIASAGVEADANRATAWSQKTSDLETLHCTPADFGPILFSATRDIASRLPGEEALFWDDLIEAARISRPPGATHGLEVERAYWAALLRNSGMTAIRPEVPQAFSLALRFAYHVFETAQRFDPWAMALVNRFAARLTGEVCNTPDDSAHRRRAEDLANLSEGAAVPTHGTAQLILRTAIQTILEDGSEAATFRQVAQRAGLSVSSVQHFFGSRRAYLIAAFQAIYEAVRDRTVKAVPAENSLTVSELTQLLANSSLPASKLHPQEFAAMQGLMLSAARDADTRVLAEGLVARAGQTSWALLRALKSPRDQIGRLDAQIISLTLTQFVTLEIAASESSDDAYDLPSLTKHLLSALFEQ